jgi:hypothetical protein
MWGNPSWHQYSCITNPQTHICSGNSPAPSGYSCVKNPQEIICRGQAPAGFPGYGPGAIHDEKYHPNACEETLDDNKCVEQCIANQWNKPAPTYGWPGPGTDCKEYDNDVNENCRKQCGVK